MGFVLFGVREVPIDVEEYRVYCQCCETITETEVLVFSQYYHLYWLPVFPIGKQCTTICTKCGLKSSGRSFDGALLSEFQEIKGKYRHPWYTYLGIALFVILVMGFVLNS